MIQPFIAGVYNLLTEAVMEGVPVELDSDLVALLEELQRPAKAAARELIVLELYRQGDVSSGRAAQLLGMEREEFIHYASKQGIPYFQLEGDELQRELDAIKKL
jgi:predicted HTH domain antitoxin